jgi:hypothetical protein
MSTMNDTEILDTLGKASLFQLYRRTARGMSGSAKW